MITKPGFTTSTSLKLLEAEGSLLHGSHTTEGEVVSGTTDCTSKSSLSANGTWHPWGTNGYKSYSKDYDNHANVVEVSWEKGTYPGYWHVFQKSLIAHDADGNNYYDFTSVTYMFEKSVDSGYHTG
ncbi:MAG TPA: hypothetical protein VFJ19_15350 [Nocardioidaceae bacterium]|nr:hypothetical protein [Nocardioidaceae bacterium]